MNVAVANGQLDHLAEQQLQGELQGSIPSGNKSDRPLLRHLNADTTWLLSLPYPSTTRAPEGRLRFNILIDPWLKGPQVDYARWFSTQHHVVSSSVQTISELNSILATSERDELQSQTYQQTSPGKSQSNYVDAVIVSHEFTDHCHRETLLEISRDVPVFATHKAYNLIRSWKHFETVVEITVWGQNLDWQTTRHPLLPSWLGLSRIVTRWDPGYLHSAVVVFVQTSPSKDKAEAIIYTPHGVESGSFSFFQEARPEVRCLALLHGLDDISLSVVTQLNLGALNALKAQKQIQARYWIGTHDEKKKADGIVGPIMRRKEFNWEKVSKYDQKELAKLGIDRRTISDAQKAYHDLASGESLVLEWKPRSRTGRAAN